MLLTLITVAVYFGMWCRSMLICAWHLSCYRNLALNSVLSLLVLFCLTTKESELKTCKYQLINPINFTFYVVKYSRFTTFNRNCRRMSCHRSPTKRDQRIWPLCSSIFNIVSKALWYLFWLTHHQLQIV